MDARGSAFRRIKQGQHSRHRYTCIRHPDEDLLRGFECIAHQNSRSRTLLSGAKVRWFLGEGEIACLRVIGRREAGQPDRAVSDDLAMELIRNLSCGERDREWHWVSDRDKFRR